MPVVKKPVQLFGVVAVESNARGRAGPPADEATLEMALEIQDQIEAMRAYPAQKRPETPTPMRAVEQYDFVDGRMQFHQRQSGRLDRPRKKRPRKTSAHERRQRNRPGNVADRSVQHDQYLVWTWLHTGGALS